MSAVCPQYSPTRCMTSRHRKRPCMAKPAAKGGCGEAKHSGASRKRGALRLTWKYTQYAPTQCNKKNGPFLSFPAHGPFPFPRGRGSSAYPWQNALDAGSDGLPNDECHPTQITPWKMERVHVIAQPKGPECKQVSWALVGRQTALRRTNSPMNFQKLGPPE